MLFNSIGFIAFFPVVFFLYWIVAKGNLRIQNILLLVASYFFYGCWDYRFLFLLAFSTALDYYSGLKIFHAQSNSSRKLWLWISIGLNLGFLGFFKYFNFFIESFETLLSSAGLATNFWTLSILLPVGISFYTFHGLSYVLDIYNKKIEPTRNWVDYSLFVSFFPLLVAGPIERASHLLPQIQSQRSFSTRDSVSGLKQITWGFIKKLVIADNCAVYADMVFNNHESYGGSTLLLGAIFFAFQIYCDFSGYSDIALGSARLLGFSLLRNFAYPYFSRDIAEFWRRWHISLSSWFRDYVYIPLGGNKGTVITRVRNVFIIFLLSGFWHGANWTFVVWGLLNALYFLPLLLLSSNRDHLEIVAKGKLFPTFREVLSIQITFFLTVLAWIFFRADSVEHGLDFLFGIISPTFFELPEIPRASIFVLILIFVFIIVEWSGREEQYAIEKIGIKWPRPVRWAFYSLLIFMLGMYMQTNNTTFIYFQF